MLTWVILWLTVTKYVLKISTRIYIYIFGAILPIINEVINEDFRYMKIHIFALRWRDEMNRSSQLRTLLKRVVVNRTWKNSGPYPYIYLKSSFTWMFIWTQFIDQLPVGLLAQLVERCTGIAEVMGSNPIRAWIFRSYLQLLVSVVFLAAKL